MCPALFISHTEVYGDPEGRAATWRAAVHVSNKQQQQQRQRQPPQARQEHSMGSPSTADFLEHQAQKA
jgi:hypothetical protein